MHLQLLPFLLLTLTSTQVWSKRQTAALLIGGYYAKDLDGPTLKSVELFGCEGQEGSIEVADLAEGNYMAGGLRLQQDTENDHVIVCGGYQCIGTICGISNECRTWSPATNVWSTDVAPLKGPRWSFIMGLAPNITQTGDGIERPLVLGYTGVTEMYNEAENSWEEYLESEATWYGISCLFQDTEGEHAIYRVGKKVQKLDVRDWSVTDLGDVPQPLESPGMCSPVTINGQRGILTRLGSFFNLSTRQWEKKAFPPNDPFATLPNGMFSFRGRPTIFGQPRCNAGGICESIEVIQYVPDKDKWIFLGDMTRPRGYITMVEVPAEYCDHFVPPMMK